MIAPAAAPPCLAPDGRRPASDLTPTTEFPGLHVAKPSPYESATGSYVCGSCPATATAHGDVDVWALVQDYTYFHGRTHAGENR
nr:hypothetical protein [Streptomyces sp. KL118A]